MRDFDRLLQMYEHGGLTRRELLEGLTALAVVPAGSHIVGLQPAPASVARPIFQASTINHVTLQTADVARSKDFYQALTGLAIRDEGKDFCEFRVTDGFLGIYTLEAGQRVGFNHFCFGVENYEPKAALAKLQTALPDVHPTLEFDDQVYLRDPDGVRVQIADVNYKRKGA